jgi:hypothetical protein
LHYIQQSSFLGGDTDDVYNIVVEPVHLTCESVVEYKNGAQSLSLDGMVASGGFLGREMSLHHLAVPQQVDNEQKTKEKSVQVDVNPARVAVALKIENIELRRRLQVGSSPFDRTLDHFQWLKSSPAKFKFYTGVSVLTFDELFGFLGPEAYSLTMWRATSKNSRTTIDPKVQLALTLVRLRRGYTLQDISYRFNISASTVGKVFITWIQFLYKKFDMLRKKMFVPQSRHRPMPKSSRNSLLRKVRVVIDCTEIKTQCADNFKQQGNLYSSYKSNATAKILIGTAPCGSCMFVSDAYEGSISDREIVVKSGFLDCIVAGDVVLVDRGFDIADLLATKKATLIIPPFLRSNDQKEKKLSNSELLATKLIARSRIHIERFNRLIKINELICGIVPLNLAPLLTQIVFVLCCLANFQEPLAK